MDPEYIKKVGISAAFKGSEILRSHFGRLSGINKKKAGELVTAADAESETAIIETIRQSFPDHSVLAEESGLSGGDPALQWIIDPLDGTTNFAHQFSIYCVSIAFALEGRLLVGIVLSPPTEELFTAVADRGAALNGRPIRVSTTATVAESLLVTGFPYDCGEKADAIMQRFNKCMQVSQGLRRLGSAAMDLCYVACGRFDAFWEQNLMPWDSAGGVLVAKEAGAAITDFSNKPFQLAEGELLATNGKIHNEMLELLNLKESLACESN